METPPNTDSAGVSVIIPSKDRPDVVARLLQSINAQIYPKKEVLVIDDGSNPPLCAVSGEKIYRNETSRGAGPARNVGAEKAGGEYLLFLDDDTILHDQLLIQKCVDTLRSNPTISVIALRQLHPDLSPWYLQASSYHENCLASSFFGVGFFIRRMAMLQIGGFCDLIKFPNYEENEMSLRLIDAQHEIAYLPELTLIHAEDARNRNWEHRHYCLYRNACYTTILRYPIWAVIPGILSHLRHYVKLTRTHSTFTLAKFFKLLMEMAANLPVYLHARRAIRTSTMLKVLRRNRAMVPFDCA